MGAVGNAVGLDHVEADEPVRESAPRFAARDTAAAVEEDADVRAPPVFREFEEVREVALALDARHAQAHAAEPEA